MKVGRQTKDNGKEALNLKRNFNLQY